REIFLQSTDRHGLALVLHSLGVIHTKTTEYGKALNFLFQSLEIFNNEGDETEICKVSNSIGVVFKDTGEYSRALEYYLQAIEISERLDLPFTYIMTMNTALLYQAMDLKEKALELYSKAENLCEKNNDSYGLTKVYNCSASLYGALEDFLKAEEYARKALFLTRELNDSNGIAFSLAELGIIFSKNGKYTEALEFLKEAENYEALQPTRYRIFLFKGNISALLKDFDNAETMLLKAYELAEAENHMQRKWETLQLLSEIYSQKGEAEKELASLKQTIELERSLREEQTQRTILEMQARFDLQQAEKERDLFRFKSEKLEGEVEEKSRELTSMAMRLIQKNEFLLKISQLAGTIPQRGDETDAQLAILQREISHAIRSDDEWAVFEKQFQLVHRDFLLKLSGQYPQLTLEQHKVCALLKMKMSSKDIANLLCLSPRTVESHRYRIRKKMNLTAETDLLKHLASM
ncbi:MAG TPA: tetratricopeptide repeat protein, partial [Patescibacteria group bacterium]|nr:tetratricopeptide repeat protein [Patescibacteria group bacterium]